MATCTGSVYGIHAGKQHNSSIVAGTTSMQSIDCGSKRNWRAPRKRPIESADRSDDPKRFPLGMDGSGRAPPLVIALFSKNLTKSDLSLKTSK